MAKGLIRINTLKKYNLGASDGEIGKVSDFLYDDEASVIRYLVVDTRMWLPGRKVLISPIAINSIYSNAQIVSVILSKEQIKNSPPLDSDAPVSRQYEIYFNRYYRWLDYWAGSGLWGEELYPSGLKYKGAFLDIENKSNVRSNLRSSKEVDGYHIHTQDEDIGHIEDFLFDEDTWAIRYLVIDTSNWLPGSKRVIVHSNWVDTVDWADSSVTVRMTREQIASSPEYNANVLVNREYEKLLFDHYKFPYYW